MLKRFLLGAIALFFIMVGIFILTVGYFFTYPDKFFGIVHKVTEKAFQGQKFEENEEFYLEGIDKVFLSAEDMKLSLRTYTGSALKITIKGMVPEFEKGPFVLQTLEGNNLQLDFSEPMANSWFQINVNGEEVSRKSDAKLEAQIYLPQDYKGHLEIKTRGGDVKISLAKELFYELDLQSDSGKIMNKVIQKIDFNISPDTVGHIKVHTVTGSISVDRI